MERDSLRYRIADLWVHSGRSFWGYQAGRVKARSVAFSRAFASAVFWMLLFVLYAWLSVWGLGAVARVLLVAWVTMSLPAVLLQIALAVDIANYALTRRILVYPFLHAKYASEPIRPTQPDSAALGVWKLLVGLATVTSPFSGLATWCCNVLGDLPESTHIPLQRSVDATGRRTKGDRRFGLRRLADQPLGVDPPSPLLGTLATYMRVMEGARSRRNKATIP